MPRRPSTAHAPARAIRRALLLATGLLLLLAAPAGAITVTADPTTLADSALRDASVLDGASWDVPASTGRSAAVATEAIQGFPADGSDYLVLSSGDAGLAPSASQGDPEASPPEADVANGGGTRGGAQDVSILRLDLDVPAGNNCVSLTFRYFSEEYPEYVDQGYNDGFLAELDPSSDWTMSSHQITAPANFAFMPGGEFVSINSATMAPEDAAGTVYDGGTQLLSASAPLTGGVHSLVLSVWDDGDTRYDSAVFVDDIHVWTAPPDGCIAGATAAPTDTTAPQTALGSTPSATTGPSASFGFSADETGSTFECRLDDGAWTSCTSTHTESGLASGEHSFAVRATDAAGNTDATPASYTWTVDATPPDTTLTSGPPGVSGSDAATFAFHADEPGSTFECRLDGGAWTSCTSAHGESGLADGEHSFAVRSTDAVGNTDATPATRAWTVDTSAPDAPVIDVTSAPAPLSSDPDPAIAFTGDPGADLQCRLDGGAWTTCSSPLRLTGLADGRHVVEIRQSDAAGNWSAPARREWRVDTAGPAAPTVVSGPSGTVAPGRERFALAGEPGATLQCRLDGGDWAPCATTFDLTGVALGAHVLQVRQIDAAGNASPATTRRWTVAAAPVHESAAGPAAPSLTAVVGTARDHRARPLAVASGALVPAGCSIDAGAIRLCTVTVYVRGKVVGRGRARYGADGAADGRVTVHLSARLRHRLARHSVRARFEFRARPVDGEGVLRSRRRVTLAARAQWILPGDGLFESGRARLRPEVRRYLRAVAPELRSARTIRIVGHTDSIGTTADNHRLGLRRARSVRRQLHRLHVHARMLARSRGESRPRATNETAAGRALNRRVELRVLR